MPRLSLRFIRRTSIRCFSSRIEKSLLRQSPATIKTAEFITRPKKLRTYVWGLSRTGALGINTSAKEHEDYFRYVVHHPTRLQFAENTEVSDVAAGYGFSAFAVNRSDGETLYGTGINTDSQLGLPSISSNPKFCVVIYPIAINLPRRDDDTVEDLRVQCMSAGRAHLVVVTNNGAVFTLGNNAYGQCARRIVQDEVHQESGIIQRMECPFGEDNVIQVECGQDHTLFLTESGKLYACGWGADGQTGLGNYECTSVPQLVEGDINGVKLVRVSSRADCVLALSDEGEVFGWGNSEYGQLSDNENDITQINTPRRIQKLRGIGKIVDIAAGGAICAALNEAGEVFTWGFGILGLGPNVEHSSKPKQIPAPLFGRTDFDTDVKVESIHSGVFHFGAINSKGDLFMWGKNRFGCLGLGHKKDQYFPFKVGINAKIKKVTCGVDHSLAICKPFV